MRRGPRSFYTSAAIGLLTIDPNRETPAVNADRKGHRSPAERRRSRASQRADRSVPVWLLPGHHWSQDVRRPRDGGSGAPKGGSITPPPARMASIELSDAPTELRRGNLPSCSSSSASDHASHRHQDERPIQCAVLRQRSSRIPNTPDRVASRCHLRASQRVSELQYPAPVAVRDFKKFRGEQPPGSSRLFAAPLEDRCRRNSRSQTEERDKSVLIFLATAYRRTHTGTCHADTSQPDWYPVNRISF